MIEIICQKCNVSKPHTEVFWYHNQKNASGLEERSCKKCQQNYLKVRRHIVSKGLITEYREAPLTEFDKKCLHDSAHRVLVVDDTSIYREI